MWINICKFLLKELIDKMCLIVEFSLKDLIIIIANDYCFEKILYINFKKNQNITINCNEIFLINLFLMIFILL